MPNKQFAVDIQKDQVAPLTDTLLTVKKMTYLLFMLSSLTGGMLP